MVDARAANRAWRFLGWRVIVVTVTPWFLAPGRPGRLGFGVGHLIPAVETRGLAVFDGIEVPGGALGASDGLVGRYVPVCACHFNTSHKIKPPPVC